MHVDVVFVLCYAMTKRSVEQLATTRPMPYSL